MDVGKSFSYPFQDEKWLTKLFIGAVVSVVPILNFAWAGYMVDLVKNVMGNVALPLPEWSDFGDKFVKGLILWVAGLIYAIPFLCLGSAVFIPLIGATSDAQNVQEAMAAAFTGIGIVVACLMLLYGLALTFYFPAMFINFARKGTFGACFQICAVCLQSVPAQRGGQSALSAGYVQHHGPSRQAQAGDTPQHRFLDDRKGWRRIGHSSEFGVLP